MTTKKLECSHCESEFIIKHDMDGKHYKPSFCVFCGGILEEDEVDLSDVELSEDE